MHEPLTAVLTALFESEAVSIPALFRLSDMTPEELSEFDARWPSVNAERRTEIAQHMADISEENFEVDFSPAFAVMLRDGLAAVRRSALDGLWDTTNLNLVRPIMRLTTDDPDIDVRATAARTLAHFVLMGEWGQIPKPVKQRVVDWLVPLYQDRATPAAVRRAALEALGPADHELVPGFIRAAYESRDMLMQASALFAMGSSADPAWLTIVLDEMRSPFAELRLEAAKAAGEIGRSTALDRLRDRLLNDDDYEVRCAAVVAIGKIGGDAARRVLSDSLDDDELFELHDLIEEALEEMDWSSQTIDSFDLDWDDDEDDLW